MALDEELRRIGDAAVAFAADGEELAGIVPAEPASGVRLYVCAYGEAGETSWLVLDVDGSPVEDRTFVRDAVSIAGLCELAEEAAGSEPEEARIASPAHLDAVGAAAAERDRQSFIEAMKNAPRTVEDLVHDVERNYKRPLG